MMIRVLCFGDSITLGEKDIEFGGWVDRLKLNYLKRFIEAPLQQFSVYNLGIASESTDGLVSRFEGEFKARYLKGQKHIVIFAYGANDIVIHKAKNITPINYFIDNLTRCIKKAKTVNAQIILCGLLPIGEHVDGYRDHQGMLRNGADIQKYNAALKALSEKLNCVFVDGYQVFIRQGPSALLNSDGLHPNSSGHEKLQNLIEHSLSKLMKIS